MSKKTGSTHLSLPRLSRRGFLKMAGIAAIGVLTSHCDFKSNTPTVNMNKYFLSTTHDSLPDYATMWWADGLRAKQKIFNIQTSRFGLSFDQMAFTLRKFGALSNPVDESDLLTQDNQLIEDLPDTALEAVIETGGKRYKLIQGGEFVEDCKLVESGRYFQRRWLAYPKFEDGAPQVKAKESGFEVSAWPDRAAFIMRLIANVRIENAALEITIQLPVDCNNLLTSGEASALANPKGSGYIFFKTSPDEIIVVDKEKARCTVRFEKSSAWAQGDEHMVGMVVYPALDVQKALGAAAAAETTPLVVKANQVKPEAHDLAIQYDRQTGWHYVGLRNDGDVSDYAESTNHRIEQVSLTIQNPDKNPRTVRLNFGKEKQVFGITGLSAILRDSEQNPLGIPVQLSKNWHVGAQPREGVRYQGPWYHGLTMLTIPPGQTVNLEYVSVNGFWGQLPAASHAQLCLIGWGSNQLWDQSAIGSWGESICYEPDQGQSVGAVLDTRPLMVWSMVNEPRRKWGWTNNVGGADFLVLYDKDVNKMWNSRMRTMYRRYCPNMTEVSYAGVSLDKKIGLIYTVTLYRTNDIVRGVYRFRYDVKEKVEFSKLVLFQCGSDNYSYTAERKFAYGDENGLTKEWETQWGGYAYHTDRMELKGAVPWVSMHEAENRDTSGYGAWANRGIIVRQWKAVLGGKETNAWIAERSATVGNVDTSLVDFTLPPGVTELLPGDYVEAELVHVVMPQFADDYYGPNQNLVNALKANQNTWKMIYREASGNNLDVKVTRGGETLSTYPIHILGTGGNIEFSVTGGLSFVPVTFSGVANYRGFKLEQKTKDGWVEIDQSYHGKDFWQVDFNAKNHNWDVTYSLPLDSPGDERQTRQFRLVAPPALV
jgi:hypothetical protein